MTLEVISEENPLHFEFSVPRKLIKRETTLILNCTAYLKVIYLHYQAQGLNFLHKSRDKEAMDQNSDIKGFLLQSYKSPLQMTIFRTILFNSLISKSKKQNFRLPQQKSHDSLVSFSSTAVSNERTSNSTNDVTTKQVISFLTCVSN